MDAKRGLIRHGITLFLAGLLTGFAVQVMANPRAGLSGHLEGVMNGTFLIALGCAWTELRLGARTGGLVYRLVLFGTWANWTGTTLSGIFAPARRRRSRERATPARRGRRCWSSRLWSRSA